jgi:dienelactone hydrolase
MRISITIFSLFVILFFTSGCQAQSTDTNSKKEQSNNSKNENIDFPPIGNPKKVSEGVLVYEIKMKRENKTNNVWIYLPEKPKKEKIACVLIAPAGSRLIDGAGLGEGDRPEHIPYIKAGFAVVAYDIDDEPKDDSDESTIEAARAFKSSNAGLINQKIALDYALAKFPIINSEQIFVVGHSSAATHALLVAANEPRIKGVIAYSPATDIEKFIGEGLVVFDDYISGFQRFISQSSPINNVSKINIPAFIFHAEDDSTVSIKMTEEFVEKLKKNNSDVTFVRAKSGDHYYSMIKQGIPKGIEWLNRQISK